MSIVLICASANPWWIPYGGGWVQFVAALALLTIFVLYMIYLLSVIEKLPARWPLIVSDTCYLFIFFIL